MSIIKGLFLGLKNQKVIPFNQMTPELHNEISSGLAKIMMAAKMTKAKLTKAQRDYITNQAKQVQEFEDRYITGIKDSAGNLVKKGKEKIGELFDLKGRKMDASKSIIGGEQAGIMGIEKTSPKFIEYAIRNIKDMKKPSMVQDEIKFIINREGMYKNLTSDDAKQILEAIEPIVKKADGGRIGFEAGTPEHFRKYLEEREMIEKRQRLEQLLKEYEDDMNRKKVMQQKQEAANGGRIGYKNGPDQPGRRNFMKIMGGLATLPFVGKFFKTAEVAAPVAEKAVEVAGQAPSYFFDLVAKIKLLGEPRRTPSYKERVNEYQYTGKDGIEYELIEDLDTGEIMIQKDKIGVGGSGDKSFDVLTDRTEMRYKKPKPDEGDPNPSAEYEEYKVEFDSDGTAADASQIDEISKKEIIEEIKDQAPSIKKAGGGIARMLGE
jgi:hypothetical protein